MQSGFHRDFMNASATSRRIRRRLFGLLAMTLWLVSSHVSFASEGSGTVSTEEIQELIEVIEKPERRDAFVKDLKALVAAKKALKEKKGDHGEKDQQIPIVRWAYNWLEGLSSRLRHAVVTIDDVFHRLPEIARSIKGFLSTTENRLRLFILVIEAAMAAMLALLLSFLLSRPARSVLGRMKGLPSKIGWGSIFVLLKGFPYLILWVAFALLSEMWPSFPYGRAVGLLFFGVLFLYRLALAVSYVALAPADPPIRLLPVGDEDAQYLWVWMRRFALYAVLYFLVTRAALWTPSVRESYAWLRGLFLIPFPLLFTIFILQIAREIREKRGAPAFLMKGGRLIEVWVRYWPILAVGYTWAIFLSLLVRYEEGFEYLFRATMGTVVASLILLVCFRAADALFRRLFRINERIQVRFPGLEERANRYVLIVRKGVLIGLTVVGAGVIGDIWGIPVLAFLASEAGGLVVTRALAILATVAAVVSIIEASNALSAFLLREKGGVTEREIAQKKKTLIPVIRTAVNIGTGFVGGVVILDRLGVNTTPILAGAGIVGLAVGFGSQTLVKDLINGLFILFEESIRVGDYATLGNQGGIVESVGLRTVKLRDMDGTLHIIPNSAIESVSNYSKVYSRVVMDIGIAYREDVDEVIEILRELGRELQMDPAYGPDILEPLEIFGLDRFEDSAVIIRARFKTRPLKQWRVKREFYRRMKRVFDERGIEMPFPHRTIYMGEPKEGKAPPLSITIQERSVGEKAGHEASL